MLSESPDLYIERDQIVRDLERLPLATGGGGENHFFMDERPLSVQLQGEAEDSDDEQDDEDDPDDVEYGDLDGASPMRRSQTKANGLYAVGRMPKIQLCAKVSNSSTDTKDR